MTPPDYASIGILVTAIGAVVVNIIVALRTSNKVDTINTKTDAISLKVDGAASAQVNKIEALQAKVDNLHGTITEKDKAAVILAQAIKDK